MKSRFKFLIFSLSLLLLFFAPISFANNITNENSSTSNTNIYQTSDIINNDLYISDSKYEIGNVINGNVFAKVKNLAITPSGSIKGNLYAVSDIVNIQSDITYSDNQKDDLGNPVITINNHPIISGNVFILANKFVLESGCEINGDLYICAKEVSLKQNSKINGNLFVCSNKLVLNSKINGSMYINTQEFDMQYFTIVNNNLNLNTDNAILNGLIYKNSNISAKNITTQDKFINKENFVLNSADNLTFSGEILGDATINSKNITFKNKEDDNNLTCKILGNLSYSSNKKIQIPENIVLKEINYSKYSSSKSILSNLFDYVLNIIGILVLTYVIYILILKSSPKYLYRISNISVLGLLKYLGIGLVFFILVPLVSILLLKTSLGNILGIILLLIYIILLIVSHSIFIIAITTFIKNKFVKDFNIYLYILAVSIIFSVFTLIPYVGFIISILVNLAGFGMITINLIPNKK